MQHIDVEFLKKQISLPDLVGLWIDLTRSGRNYVGLCPFHKETSPSFTVFVEGHYHCFGCGQHGDAISFVEQMLGVDFSGAIRWLSDRMGSLPMQEVGPRNQVVPTIPIPWNVLSYWHSMAKGPMREYYHSRKLSDATIDFYMLGWDGKNYVIPLWEGIPRESLVYGVKFRSTKRSTKRNPKYFGLRGRQQTRLFNKHLLEGAREVVVVIGEFDAILGWQWGYNTVSPTSGQESWLPEWVELFNGIEKIYVVPDEGERAAGYRISSALGSCAKLCKFPPHVKDLTSFAQMGYLAEDFRNLVLERHIQRKSFNVDKFWEADNNVVSTGATRVSTFYA